MSFSPNEILNFVEENDVKFIRLTFCDVFGNLKNIAIMPDQLERAFKYGIPFDASCITNEYSDLLLIPDISTLSVLPWRPKSGRVVRFFCNIQNTDGSEYSGDLRKSLQNTIRKLSLDGYSCELGTKCEFYLFDLDQNANPTKIPHDEGGYLDVAPIDKCENARREICLSLEEMGLSPKSSCHKHGPGQNEIDFKNNEPVTAADNMVHYKSVVKSIAAQNGLFASFMPRPLENQHGSALSISLSIKKNGVDIFNSSREKMPKEGEYFIAGVLNKISEMTAFLNSTTNSYRRFGIGYAPKYVNWGYENRAQLIRIPHSIGFSPKIEIRSADACCNPYIVFNLLLSAGFDGIKNKTELPLCAESTSKNTNFELLPSNLNEAVNLARNSEFIKMTLSEETRTYLFNRFDKHLSSYEKADSKSDFEDNYYFKTI